MERNKVHSFVLYLLSGPEKTRTDAGEQPVLIKRKVVGSCQNGKTMRQGGKHSYCLSWKKIHFELVDVEYVKEAGTWYLRAYIGIKDGLA